MDDRLQKALDFSKYRISLFNTKENIKIKVDSMLTFSVNGGIFKISTDLISFVKAMKDSGYSYLVILDMNKNPIEISNLDNFLKDITSKYFEATNFYYSEYTKLRKMRSVKEQFEDIIEEK
jgi:hypothetical protein